MENFKAEFYSRTRIHALDVLRFLDTLPNSPTVLVLKKQLVRSATSTPANILEARSASSRKDYINFYTHALKSANESLFWIDLIKDYLRLSLPECNRLWRETEEIAKILAKSILTLKTRSK